MTHKQTMDKIIWEWVVNKQNLTTIRQLMPADMSTERALMSRIEKQEKVLKDNGYLYKWSYRLETGDNITQYLFREHKAVRLRVIHKNLLKKVKEDWMDSQLEQVTLCEV